MPSGPPIVAMMPMPKNQKQLTGKKHSEEAYYPGTVRECMYWPEPEEQAKPGSGKKGGKGKGRSGKRGGYINYIF